MGCEACGVDLYKDEVMVCDSCRRDGTRRMQSLLSKSFGVSYGDPFRQYEMLAEMAKIHAMRVRRIAS